MRPSDPESPNDEEAALGVGMVDAQKKFSFRAEKGIDIGQKKQSYSYIDNEHIDIGRKRTSFIRISEPGGKQSFVEIKANTSFVELPKDLTAARQKFEEEANKDKAKPAYTEHQILLPELARHLETSIDIEHPRKSAGLTAEQVEFRQKRDGPNRLSPPVRTPAWIRFLEKFLDGLMLLLLGAASLSLIAYGLDTTQPINLYLGLILVIVVVLTCFGGFYQESKSENIMEVFRVLLPQAALVIRDGETSKIGAEELVVGDLVVVKLGDKIPADLRIVSTSGLKVDQAALTGEAEPQETTEHCTDNNFIESHNLIWNGTLAVDGEAIGVVIRVGDATLIGALAKLAGAQKTTLSTLQKEVNAFVKYVTYLALSMAISVFVIGVSLGHPWLYTFINAFITLLVANVPEGLPATVTTCLTIIAKRMGERNVFVKRLDSIETLGAVSVICSDKTGTLTQNKMTVKHVWAGRSLQTSEEFQMAFKMPSEGFTSAEIELANVAMLNSRVQVTQLDEPDEKGNETELQGDATELGMYNFFGPIIGAEKYRERFPKLFEIPFNSTNKWQLSIHRHFLSGQVILLKGAPEVVMKKCSHFCDESGESRPMTDEYTSNFQTTYDDLGSLGERVLGFAFRKLSAPLDDDLIQLPSFRQYVDENLLSDFTFGGLVALQDPPRPEVSKAIADCHTAGIKVVMITGDHTITAAAIARQIGLITSATKDELAKQRGVPPTSIPETDVLVEVVHGAQIHDFTEDDWERVLSKKEIVFARTSPQQKLLIVEHFQAKKAIIAMTGDGVNDSPALRKADIGVAMGIGGSDVAREAANIVLLDDNFASIVVGVREGRLLFDNLKKTIAYTITHLLPEFAPTFLTFIGNMPLGMSAILVICIDLLTELAPAIAFAFEEAEANIMTRPPRNPITDRLVTVNLMAYAYTQAGIIETGACLLNYFLVFKSYDIHAQDLPGLGQKYFISGAPDLHINGHVYDESKQLQIIAKVQSSYYVMLVMSQAWHVWTCRTRSASIFTHGIFGNPAVNRGVIIAVCLMLLIVYTPGIQTGLQSDTVGPIYFVPMLLSGGLLWIWSETRKAISRAYPDPNNLFNRMLSW